MTSIDMINAVNNARTVLDVGRAHGWPLPDTCTAAAEVTAAALAVVNGPAPELPTAPTNGKSVAAWVAKAADIRVRDREARIVAQELAAGADRDVYHAAQSVCGDYIERLAAEFDHDAARFRELLTTAPRSLSGYESPEQMAEYGELLRTVETLTRSVYQRTQLAVFSGEGSSLGRHGAVWLVLDTSQAGEHDVDTITATAQKFYEALPATLEDWATLATVGLRLAGVNEAALRLEEFNRVVYHHGITSPSRGVIAHRWADALHAARQTAGA